MKIINEYPLKCKTDDGDEITLGLDTAYKDERLFIQSDYCGAIYLSKDDARRLAAALMKFAGKATIKKSLRVRKEK
jgi:hypothetical protein